MNKEGRSFDVALSFAGEDREYVEEVADILKKMGLKVWYDKYEEVSLWGKDLYEHFIKAFRDMSNYVVIFCSENYANKNWTNHERKAAQARAITERREYILPVRFDNYEIPGILDTIGYLHLSDLSPLELAERIREKVGFHNVKEFVPVDPDLLFEKLEAETNAEKKDIVRIANIYLDSLKLMSPYERKILLDIHIHSCPCGFPNDAHQNLEYLCRLAGLQEEELISILSRLDCLGIISRITEDSLEDVDEEGRICKGYRNLSVVFEPRSTDDPALASAIVTGMMAIMAESYCPEHIDLAIENLDFSCISSYTYHHEDHD